MIPAILAKEGLAAALSRVPWRAVAVGAAALAVVVYVGYLHLRLARNDAVLAQQAAAVETITRERDDAQALADGRAAQLAALRDAADQLAAARDAADAELALLRTELADVPRSTACTDSPAFRAARERLRGDRR